MHGQEAAVRDNRPSTTSHVISHARLPAFQVSNIEKLGDKAKSEVNALNAPLIIKKLV